MFFIRASKSFFNVYKKNATLSKTSVACFRMCWLLLGHKNGMEWKLWSWRVCDLKMNMYIVNVYITVIFRSFWLDYFHDYVETVMFASECGTAACVRREPVGGKAAAEL